MVIPYLVLLCLVGLERLVELRISRTNARAALENGGIERGQHHFRAMKVLHMAFLIGCAAEVVLLDRPFIPILGASMLALALGAQGLRYWAIGTLREQWTVRVIVVPGRPVVTGGPYRYLRHPNYLAVILEGLAIPLIHSAWLTALTFTALNGLLLWVRVRCEESALTQHCAYRQHLGARHRWLPSVPTSKE